MIINLIVNLVLATLNILPIYLIAALGGYLSQRVGVYDISMEGNMTLGAVLGIIGFWLAESPWMGLALGFCGGVVFGLILATLSVRYNLNQIVIGFGLWFVGLGFSSFFYKLYVPFEQATKGFPPVGTMLGLGATFAGPLRFLELDIIFYLSLILLLVISFTVYRTKLGLQMRSVGENPAAADAAGIKLFTIRYITVIVGGGLVGVAGAYLAVDFLQGFTLGLVAGRGWIAFSIIIFSRWIPSHILWGCLLFAGINGLQIRLQTIGVTLPSELLIALPYIATLIALVIIMSRTGKARIPSALGMPYFRE
ncbi:MAG: ABC transporter permease [Proteobacteria bacterium]|nr:ABC transporter permease [Pseudomonadota bacterium]